MEQCDRHLLRLCAFGVFSGAICAQSGQAGEYCAAPAPRSRRRSTKSGSNRFKPSHPACIYRMKPWARRKAFGRLSRGEVDFAASDILPGKDIQDQIGIEPLPAVVGAVVPAYNIQGLARDLRFTPELLSEIFLGHITKWNDPRIKEVNHGIHLPAADIVVVHRADGSGTTFVWSDYLSKTSPAWREAVGSGSTLHWPTGQGAQRQRRSGRRADSHALFDRLSGIYLRAEERIKLRRREERRREVRSPGNRQHCSRCCELRRRLRNPSASPLRMLRAGTPTRSLRSPGCSFRPRCLRARSASG